ncbi:MAG: MBL fold metallo-hydrolase [Gemmataceae bacterium]|nr:MBL fold metallo-hydrolase [Gemmataceae bacterium]
MRFAVLASGSSGNCSLVDNGESAFLIDAGIGPRSLEKTLAAIGTPLDRVQGLVLTHTHADHWNIRTISLCLKNNIPWWCHPLHGRELARVAPFQELQAAGLVRHYQGNPFETRPGWNWRPIPLAHDASATHGFLLRVQTQMGNPRSIGYLADLGSWNDETLEIMKSLDLLALEFNHDPAMQIQSSRPPFLISRIMGDRGHLSNQQGKTFLSRLGTLALPRHLVQIHLSEMCNLPELARTAALEALDKAGADTQVHTATGKYPALVVNLLEKSLFARTRRATAPETAF